MKNIFIILFLTTIVIFGFSQCSDDPVKEIETKDFYPLKIGNYWIYNNIIYDSVAKVVKFTKDTTKITSDIVINNAKFYKYNTALVRNTDSGFCVYDIDTLKNKYCYSMHFKYPGTAGEQWVVNNDTVQLINTNEVIQTLVGNFSCYHYKRWERFDEHYEEYHYYISPGNGLITYDVYYKDAINPLYLIRKLQMIDYKLVE